MIVTEPSTKSYAEEQAEWAQAHRALQDKTIQLTDGTRARDLLISKGWHGGEWEYVAQPFGGTWIDEDDGAIARHEDVTAWRRPDTDPDLKALRFHQQERPRKMVRCSGSFTPLDEVLAHAERQPGQVPDITDCGVCGHIVAVERPTEDSGVQVAAHDTEGRPIR